MAWKQQGNPSSNITFYTDKTPGAYPWAEVLTNDIGFKNGKAFKHKVPTYAVFVYRNGVGEIGQFKYEPKTDGGYRLSPQTVGRIVNRWLKENEK